MNLQEKTIAQIQQMPDPLVQEAAGMSHAEILDDFPELTEEDIKACLEFAADKEHH